MACPATPNHKKHRNTYCMLALAVLTCQAGFTSVCSKTMIPLNLMLPPRVHKDAENPRFLKNNYKFHQMVGFHIYVGFMMFSKIFQCHVSGLHYSLHSFRRALLSFRIDMSPASMASMAPRAYCRYLYLGDLVWTAEGHVCHVAWVLKAKNRSL